MAEQIRKIQLKELFGYSIRIVYHHRDNVGGCNFDEEFVGQLRWRAGLPGVAEIVTEDGLAHMRFMDRDEVLYYGPILGEDIKSYPLKNNGSHTHQPSAYDGRVNGSYEFWVL